MPRSKRSEDEDLQQPLLHTPRHTPRRQLFPLANRRNSASRQPTGTSRPEVYDVLLRAVTLCSVPIVPAEELSQLEPLSRGGFARVFKALWTSPQHGCREVAVKILERKRLPSRELHDNQFINEVVAMQCAQHTNIVPLYGIAFLENVPMRRDQEGAAWALVEEFVAGGALTDRVLSKMGGDSKHAFTLHESLTWMLQIASALHHMHSGVYDVIVIHRDIKPDNILLQPMPDGQLIAKLADFGLAALIDLNKAQLHTAAHAKQSIILGPHHPLHSSPAFRSPSFRRSPSSAVLSPAQHTAAAHDGHAVVDDGGTLAMADPTAAAGTAAAAGGDDVIAATLRVVHPNAPMTDNTLDVNNHGTAAVNGRHNGGNGGATSTACNHVGNAALQAEQEGTGAVRHGERGDVMAASGAEIWMSGGRNVRLKSLEEGDARGGVDWDARWRELSAKERMHATMNDVYDNDALLRRLRLSRHAAAAAGGDKQHAQRDVTSSADLITLRYQLTGGTGSLMYMAPEVANRQAYNEKVDVFSFGMMLWEVAAGQMLVFSQLKTPTREGCRRFASRIAKGWRPPVPDSVPRVLHDLIADCTAQHPQQRPSFAEVCSRLQQIIDESANKSHRSAKNSNSSGDKLRRCCGGCCCIC